MKNLNLYILIVALLIFEVIAYRRDFDFSKRNHRSINKKHRRHERYIKRAKKSIHQQQQQHRNKISGIKRSSSFISCNDIKTNKIPFDNNDCKMNSNNQVTELSITGKTLTEDQLKFIFGIESLETLHLNKNLIEKIPSEIGRLTNLKSLELNDNKIEEIPPEIENLLNLESLELNENYITEIPPEIGSLIKLDSLYLNDNEIEKIPSEIGDLSNLLYLELENNQIADIPSEIGNLSNLEELLLSQNHITEIPTEIGNLSNLLYLHLDKNEITKIPSEIGNLEKLEVLDLDENEISKIPFQIGNLLNLKKLYLNENQIKIVPSQIGNLSNLEILDLEKNQIEVIPSQIGNLEKLNELYISNNCIKCNEKPKLNISKYECENDATAEDKCENNYEYRLQNEFLKISSENEDEDKEISNPLPGYYVDEDHDNKYIRCTNSGCDTIPKPTDTEECKSENDGKLIYTESKVVLCTKINELKEGDVNENHYVEIPFAETKTNYFVHHSITGEVFNFDRTSSNVYYVVKSSEKAIVFNPLISEKDYCADKNGQLMDRVSDFCSDNSSGMYYTCENGKCTAEYQTTIGKFEDNKEKECTCTGETIGENCKTNKNASGYYNYENDLYQYEFGKDKCTKVDVPLDGYYWNDHQYNQLIMCVDGSCSKLDPLKLLTDITDNSDLIVDTGYNLIFNGESLSSIRYKQTDENYKYKIFGQSNSAFKNLKKIYYIKVDKNSITTDGSENIEPGYYKIAGSNDYYQCDSTSCSNITLESECKDTTVGKLFDNNGQAALCLNFFNNQPIWTNAATSGKYFVKYNVNNIFGLSNNQYGLIEVTNNSITLSEEPKNVHYRYTKRNQKVLTEKICTSSKINEFKLVEGKNNIYTLSCVENDTAGLCKKTN